MSATIAEVVFPGDFSLYAFETIEIISTLQFYSHS